VVRDAHDHDTGLEEQVPFHEECGLSVEQLVAPFADDELRKDDGHDSVHAVRPELPDVVGQRTADVAEGRILHLERMLDPRFQPIMGQGCGAFRIESERDRSNIGGVEGLGVFQSQQRGVVNGRHQDTHVVAAWDMGLIYRRIDVPAHDGDVEHLNADLSQ
jgi:hypothetical protein